MSVRLALDSSRQPRVNADQSAALQGSPCAVARRASANGASRWLAACWAAAPSDTSSDSWRRNSTTLSVFILRSPQAVQVGGRGGVSWACRPASTPAIASGAAKNRHGVGHAAAVHAFFQFDGLALEHFRRAGDVVVAREQRVHLGLGVRQRAARSQFAGRVFLQDAMQVVDERASAAGPRQPGCSQPQLFGAVAPAVDAYVLVIRAS